MTGLGGDKGAHTRAERTNFFTLSKKNGSLLLQMNKLMVQYMVSALK